MFKTISNMKIKNQMLVLAGIFTLSILLLGAFMFVNLNKILNNKIESASNQVFDYIEKEVLNNFTFYENVAGVVAYNSSTQKLLNKNYPEYEYMYSKDVNSLVLSFFNTEKYITSIYMMFEYHIMAFGNSNFDSDFIKDIRIKNNETYYTRILTSTEFNLSSARKNDKERDKFFAVVRCLNNIDDLFSDKYYGNIAIIINTSLLDEICSRYAISKSSRVYIVNDSFEIMGKKIEKKDLYPDDLVVAIAKNPSGYSSFTRNRMAYIARVHPIGNTGMTEVLIIPKSEYFSELNRISAVTVIILLVLLAIISLVSVLIIKSITSPINSLLKAMENVGKGNLKFRISLLLKNETGKLAGHFNIMMDEVYNLTETIVLNQKKLYESEILNRDAKLKALQSQINPHFLYNTLASMRSIARKYGADEILEMSSALAKVLRYSIKEDDFVLVSAELENLKDYIRIYQINLSGKFDFVLNVQPEAIGYKIIKLILQPIVENALNHGIMNSIGKCTLTINCFILEDRIHFEVIDDGKGIPPDKLEMLQNDTAGNIKDYPRESLGIMNVKQRLFLCYGNDHYFHIESTENQGTKVHIQVPKEC